MASMRYLCTLVRRICHISRMLLFVLTQKAVVIFLRVVLDHQCLVKVDIILTDHCEVLLTEGFGVVAPLDELGLWNFVSKLGVQ